jgi:hypothetical protein
MTRSASNREGMRRWVLGGTFVLGALCPGAASAEQCALRYAESFARIGAIGLRGPSQAQAISEVNSLFGPRPDLCEPGGYRAFLTQLTDYSREALRAPVKQRDGMIRVAIAAAQQAPVRVLFEESKAARTQYNEMRSNVHAIADDVGITPLMQQLLDTIERQGMPPSTAPPPPVAPPPGTQAQAIRVPQVALPPWAVISLYEVRDLINQKQTDVARGKVEAILKWLETAQ